MNHLLTIIIPVHNRAELVVRTLNSLAASSLRDFQLIVVDNNSTDTTPEVCRRWIESHANLGFQAKLLKENRRGAPAARNRGLAECTTPWVYFFDSDDLFDERFVEEATEFASANPTQDVLFFPVWMEANGKCSTRSYQPTGDAAIHILTSMLSTQSMLFRTEWLRSMGGWNEQLSIWQDWELGVRVLLSRPRWKWYTARAFHHIVVHADSITGNGFSESLEGVLTAMDAALKDVHQSQNQMEAEIRRMTKALYFRARILAGKVAKEGKQEGRIQCRAWANKCMANRSLPIRLAGYFLEAYTARGGRGAWRLAIKLLK